MDYNAFVQKYVNTINPATGMYWQTADIPGFNPEMQGYIDQARNLNFQAVSAGQAPLTNAQLMMPASSPFGGAPMLSRANSYAGMDMRPPTQMGQPMPTLSSLLAQPEQRGNPMQSAPTPPPQTTLPYRNPDQGYNTLSGILRQRNSGYL